MRADRAGRDHRRLAQVARLRNHRRPARLRIEPARPGHVHVVLARDELARDAIEHVKEAVLRRLHQRPCAAGRRSSGPPARCAAWPCNPMTPPACSGSARRIRRCPAATPGSTTGTGCRPRRSSGCDGSRDCRCRRRDRGCRAADRRPSNPTRCRRRRTSTIRRAHVFAARSISGFSKPSCGLPGTV